MKLGGFTLILGAVGLIIGLSLPSGLDVYKDITNPVNLNHPENLIIGYPLAILVESISGIIGAAFGGVIGLIIDSARENNSQR